MSFQPWAPLTAFVRPGGGDKSREANQISPVSSATVMASLSRVAAGAAVGREAPVTCLASNSAASAGPTRELCFEELWSRHVCCSIGWPRG